MWNITDLLCLEGQWGDVPEVKKWHLLSLDLKSSLSNNQSYHDSQIL